VGVDGGKATPKGREGERGSSFGRGKKQVLVVDRVKKGGPDRGASGHQREFREIGEATIIRSSPLLGRKKQRSTARQREK